jgi:hypothetical protein
MDYGPMMLFVFAKMKRGQREMQEDRWHSYTQQTEHAGKQFF